MVQPVAQTSGQHIADLALSHVGSVAWGSGAATYCETFTEDMTGCGWQGASALDAWQRNASRQHVGEPAPNGAALYFGADPENEGFGHTGIVTGDDQFTSVTYEGVRTYPISTWKAPLLGWIDYTQPQEAA